jgi:AcrR family transcriptional regulator
MTDPADRRSIDREARRVQITQAAERVFLERGLGTATMEQIARAAGLSKGGLYRFYETKDELFLDIARRALEDLVARLEAVEHDEGNSSGYQWAASNLEDYLDYAIERPNRFRVAVSWIAAEYSVASETPGFEGYRAVLARAFDFARRALEKGKRDGSVLPELDTASTLLNMWGATTGVLMLLFNRKELAKRVPFEANFEAMLSECSRTILGAVKNPAADLRATHVRRRTGGTKRR